MCDLGSIREVEVCTYSLSHPVTRGAWGERPALPGLAAPGEPRPARPQSPVSPRGPVSHRGPVRHPCCEETGALQRFPLNSTDSGEKGGSVFFVCNF